MVSIYPNKNTFKIAQNVKLESELLAPFGRHSKPQIYDLVSNTFGSIMASVSKGEYRYGFNGMEKDNELKGEGNSYSYAYRLYDSRLGLFYGIDQLAYDYCWLSPFHFAGLNPVMNYDLEGLQPRRANNVAYLRRTSPISIKTTEYRVKQSIKRSNIKLPNNGHPSERSKPSINQQAIILNENPPHEGGQTSVGGNSSYLDAVLVVKDISLNIKDIVIYVKNTTGVQPPVKTQILIKLNENSEQGKAILNQENKWQEGLKSAIDDVKKQEPIWDQVRYDNLNSNNEKELYKHEFQKERKNWQLHMDLAPLAYRAKNGESPLKELENKAVDYLNKNPELFETKTEKTVIPVIGPANN